MRTTNRTIDYARSVGFSGVHVVCDRCQRHRIVSFSAIGLPGDTPFEELADLPQFACSECEGRCSVDLAGMGLEIE